MYVSSLQYICCGYDPIFLGQGDCGERAPVIRQRLLAPPTNHGESVPHHQQRSGKEGKAGCTSTFQEYSCECGVNIVWDGSRVICIVLQWLLSKQPVMPCDSHVTLGVSLDPDHAFSVLDMGPAADSKQVHVHAHFTCTIMHILHVHAHFTW